MPMNSEERIIKALNHEDVDRVPVFEWLISNNVIHALYPGDTLDEFVYHMDLDAVCPDLDYESEKIDENNFRDEWGLIKRYSEEEHPVPVSGPVKTMRDLNKYIPPDPHKPCRYKTLEQKLERHKGNKAVIPHLNDVLSIPSRLMSFEDFMVAISEEPELVEGLIEMTVEVNLQMAKEAYNRGVRIIYTGDDYAYNSGPMMSPRAFEKIFAPHLKKVMQGYKDIGLYIIKHCDGNIMPIIDLMVDSGIDCLDPIDPVAGMDLAFIKKRYGSRIAIKGNVDCAQTLTFRSVVETIEETKNCIRIAAPGNGYILSSSNSIHSKVKPENFKAMVETARIFGSYPINI
jgi:uroporphyrinogen decarboxylase